MQSTSRFLHCCTLTPWCSPVSQNISEAVLPSLSPSLSPVFPSLIYLFAHVTANTDIFKISVDGSWIFECVKYVRIFYFLKAPWKSNITSTSSLVRTIWHPSKFPVLESWCISIVAQIVDCSNFIISGKAFEQQICTS